MKKQQISLTLSVILAVFTYLVGTPMRVNAGSFNAVGSSDDSASPSGDSFNPGNSQLPLEPAPGSNVEIRNNSLITSEAIQNNLNEVARNILSQIADKNTPIIGGVLENGSNSEEIADTNNPEAIIAVVLQDGANSEEAANQIYACMLSLGAPPSSVRSLVASLWGLARNKSDEMSDSTVIPGKKLNLVASTQCSANYTVVVEQNDSPSVDINRLNNAITAYNKIIMESSPVVLQRLASDPQFREINNWLKQLRVALSQN